MMCFGVEFLIITACSILLNIALGVTLNTQILENRRIPTAENIQPEAIPPAEVVSYNNAEYLHPEDPV